MRFLTMWLVLAFLLMIPSSLTERGTVHAAARPNIIFILTDDLDSVSFKAALDAGLLPDIKTRLVDAGMVADNFFTVSSLCCPTRAGLLTGQYPQNSHVVGNSPENGLLQFDAAHALPVWLQAAGYRTMHVGKYLNGYGTFGQVDPDTDPRSAKYVPPGWTIWQGLDDNSTYTSYDHDWTVKVEGSPASFASDQIYHGDIVGLRFLFGMIAMAVATPSQPFYAEMTPATPHFHLTSKTSSTIMNVCPQGTGAPLNGGGSLWGMTAASPARYEHTVSLPLPMSPAFNAGRTGKPEPVASSPLMTADDIACATQIYNRRIEQMRGINDMVAVIFAILDATGQTANTIVGLGSDNGYMLGEFGLIEKAWAYERSIRVPFIAAGPGIPPHHTQTLLTDRDVAVTFAALAGATPLLVTDGRSFVPELRATSTLTRYALPLVNVESTLEGPTSFNMGAYLLPKYPFVGVRTNLRKAVIYVPPPPQIAPAELYHLDTDPYELTNLANDPAYASELVELSLLANGLTNCVGAECQEIESRPRP